MKKLKNTLIFVLLAYVLPLIFRADLLLHYKTILLIATAITIFLTQPDFEKSEAATHRRDDRNSVFAILLLSLLATALPVAEWAYLHPERHHLHWLLLGLAIIFAGAGIRIWAIRTLGRFFTATVQIQEGHQLIQHGPFRLVRHPSYLGALLTAIGSAVLLESWYSLPVAVVLMLIAYYLRITAEEQALLRNFGQAYRDYQRKSRRLIPGIW